MNLKENKEMVKRYAESLLKEDWRKTKDDIRSGSVQIPTSFKTDSDEWKYYDRSEDDPDVKMSKQMFDMELRQFVQMMHHLMLKIADSRRGSYRGIIWDGIDQLLDDPQIMQKLESLCVDPNAAYEGE